MVLISAGMGKKILLLRDSRASFVGARWWWSEIDEVMEGIGGECETGVPMVQPSYSALLSYGVERLRGSISIHMQGRMLCLGCRASKATIITLFATENISHFPTQVLVAKAIGHQALEIPFHLSSHPDPDSPAFPPAPHLSLALPGELHIDLISHVPQRSATDGSVTALPHMTRDLL